MLKRMKPSELPADAFVIEQGGSELFHYPFCGLEYVYLKGGIVVENRDAYEGWFYFKDLDGVHRGILEALLADKLRRGAAELTFMRKSLELTLEEFSLLSGCDFVELKRWIEGDGFVVDEAIRFAENECWGLLNGGSTVRAKITEIANRQQTA